MVPVTDLTGGCIGFRTGLDAVDRRKSKMKRKEKKNKRLYAVQQTKRFLIRRSEYLN
jgi:hypothetical protein